MNGTKGKLCIALGASAALMGCGGYDNTHATSSPSYLVAESATQSDYRPVVQQLYIAYFGRPADPQGEANFAAALAGLKAPTDIQQLFAIYGTDAGVRSLVDAFGTSQESIALYGEGDTNSFLTAIFNNVLGRDPEAAGLGFWAGAISNGHVSRGGAALAIMAGAMANKTEQGLADAAVVLKRVEAASYFTTTLRDQNKTVFYTGRQAAVTARASLATITGSVTSNTYQATMTTLIGDLIDVFDGSTPTPTAGVTLGDCIGNDELLKPGTVYELSLEVTEASRGVVRNDTYTSTVNGVAGFYDVSLTETETRVAFGSGATDHWKDYSEKSGQEVLAYGGFNIHDGQSGCNGGIDIYRNMPAFRTPLSLKPGESFTQVYDRSLERDCNAAFTTSYMTKMTFVNVETVTVPAGTFEACKIRIDEGDPAFPGNFPFHHYAWYVKGGRYKSLQIKYADPDEAAPTFSTRATKLSVNGV